MSQSSRRISRPLIVVLAVCVCAGMFLILHGRKSSALRDPPADAHNAPAVAARNPADNSHSDPGVVHPTSPQDVHHPARDAATSDVIQASATQLRQAAGPDAAPTTLPSAPSISSVKDLLSDAKSKASAGQFVEARAELNDALQGGKLDGEDATAIKASISEINAELIFSPHRHSDDSYTETYVVKSGDLMSKIAVGHDLTWQFVSRVNALKPSKMRAGQKLKLIQGPFLAVVNKPTFTMDVYLGGFPGEKSSMYIASYPVGLGKQDSTPPGAWSIEPGHKLINPTYYSPRGEGVIPAGDPKNPLGGFWIGLTGTDGQAVGQLSYGIHGTNEPDSIGKQSSMGCIRMRNEDVAVVYEMLVEGKSMVLVKE